MLICICKPSNLVVSEPCLSLSWTHGPSTGKTKEKRKGKTQQTRIRLRSLGALSRPGSSSSSSHTPQWLSPTSTPVLLTAHGHPTRSAAPRRRVARHRGRDVPKRDALLPLSGSVRTGRFSRQFDNTPDAAAGQGQGPGSTRLPRTLPATTLAACRDEPTSHRAARSSSALGLPLRMGPARPAPFGTVPRMESASMAGHGQSRRPGLADGLSGALGCHAGAQFVRGRRWPAGRAGRRQAAVPGAAALPAFHGAAAARWQRAETRRDGTRREGKQGWRARRGAESRECRGGAAHDGGQDVSHDVTGRGIKSRAGPAGRPMSP